MVKWNTAWLVLKKSVSNASVPFPHIIGMQFYALPVNAEFHLSSSEGYAVLECNVSVALK